MAIIPAFAGPTSTSIAAGNVLAAAQRKPAGTYTSALPANNVVVANPAPKKTTSSQPKSQGGSVNTSGKVLGASTSKASVPYANTSNTFRAASSAPAASVAPPPNPNKAYIDLINAALGRLGGQEAQAEAQVHHTYDQKNNELDSQRASADQSYGTSTTQNQQQFVTNKNQILDQASSGLRSLLRVLGQHGAGGSSAVGAVGDAVGQVSSRQRAGAGQTYGQNQQGLDTNYHNFLNGFDNSKRQLGDWLSQQVNSAKANSEQSRQSLLQQLIGLQTSTAAAQPFVNQINDSANRVDQLGNFNPTYTGVTPTYTAPDVAQYTVDQAGSPQLGNQGNNTAAGSPILNFLLGMKDKQQNDLGVF